VSDYNWYQILVVILADPPEYLLRPQYKTRLQSELQAMEKSVGDLTTLLQAMQLQNDSIKQALDANTAVVRDFSSWKPQIEAEVLHLRQDVGSLSDKLEDLLAHKETHTTALKIPFDVGPSDPRFPPSTSLGLSLHQTPLHRSDGFGVVTTLTPPLVKGTSKTSPLDAFHTPIVHTMDPDWALYQSRLAATLPQPNFPQFDGHHPKMWKTKCESYFDVFTIPRELWVKIATMHFVGSAAFWLQSSDPRLRLAQWSEFCAAVCARFERDQHNYLIRQFFHIRQIDTVVEYVEQFDTLMHQILASDPQFSIATIVNRFIDGLAPEIRAIVFIHHPLDLDTAVSLALL
jgi:hypothetical protein